MPTASDTAETKRPRQPVIDVHAHFTLPGVTAPHFGPWNEGVAMHFMDTHGIHLQLLGVSAPTPPDHARRLNDYVAGLVARYPARFGLLANLPCADIDATLAEIERACNDLSADGFTLPSNIAGLYWGDPAFEPILTELDRRSATVLLHPALDAGKEFENLGRPSNLIEVVMDTARTLVDALYAGVFRKYTNLKLIVAHAGGVLPVLAPRLFSLGTLPWVPNPGEITGAEMKAQLGRLYYDLAISANPSALSGVLELTDERHIVFGTDFPPATVQGIEDNIASLNAFANCRDLPALRFESIAGNALDLFPGIQQRIEANDR